MTTIRKQRRPGTVVPPGGRWRRDEGGQALVEFALVLPLIALMMAVAFNGWDGIQLDLRLTSAARAGAIQAANVLAANNGGSPNDAATSAINSEEDTTVYQDNNPTGADFVNVVYPDNETIAASGGNAAIAMQLVTVTISNVSVTLVPIVGNISVSAHASARYT